MVATSVFARFVLFARVGDSVRFTQPPNGTAGNKDVVIHCQDISHVSIVVTFEFACSQSKNFVPDLFENFIVRFLQDLFFDVVDSTVRLAHLLNNAHDLTSGKVQQDWASR